MLAFSRAAPSIAADFLQDIGAKKERSSVEPNNFHNLISAVTYHHFCHILLVTETNPGIGRADIRVQTPGGRLLGALLQAGYQLYQIKNQNQ